MACLGTEATGDAMLGYIHAREARPAPRWWIVAKSLSQTIIFWGIFLFILPMGIFTLEGWLGGDTWRFTTTVSAWWGGVLFVMGGLLGLASCITMSLVGRGTPLPADCARDLVVAGPYRYLRNPMAVAGLSQGVAVGLVLGSPMVVAYALVGGPIWHFFVRPWEEIDLERRFGEPYRQYRAAVRCWLPRLRGYRRDGTIDIKSRGEVVLPVPEVVRR